jgi:hypothetical protein
VKPTRTLPTCLLVVLLAACGGDGPAPGASEAASASDASGVVAGNDWVADLMATREFQEACAATPGCTEAGATSAGPTEALWRVRVVRRAAGDVRIEAVERIEVRAGDGVPVGPLAGSFALVALDAAGEVLDGQLLAFPTALRLDYADGSVPGRVDLAGRDVDVLAYLPASTRAASLAVRDRAGNTLHSLPAPRLPVSTVSWRTRLGKWLGVREAWAASQAPSRPFSGLPSHCAHVIVLRGEQDRHLARHMQWEDESRLVEPGPTQLAEAQAALGRMTPLLCQSVARIAFAVVTNPRADSVLGAVRSAGAGDLILINVAALDGRLGETEQEARASSRLMLQATLIHEAAHAAETLLELEASVPPANYAGAWGLPPRTLAAKTIARVRLEKGLLAEWTRLHDAFAAHGWAVSAPGKNPKWPAAQVVEAGFMSHYGMASIFEDISTTVEYAYMSKTTAEAYRAHNVPDRLRQDLACLASQQHTERDLPARLAAVYTKLHLLQDLGLVPPDDVRDCLGSDIGIWVDRPGIHVSQDGMPLRRYENQLTAGIGTTRQGLKVFQLEARGEAGFGGKTHPAKMRLQLELGRMDVEQAPWPRGLYELDMLGNNNFTLRLDGAPAGDFNAMDGFVLVSEASNERIVGSIFMPRSFRPHAPLPVPERHDPPLTFRFLMQK